MRLLGANYVYIDVIELELLQLLRLGEKLKLVFNKGFPLSKAQKVSKPLWKWLI